MEASSRVLLLPFVEFSYSAAFCILDRQFAEVAIVQFSLTLLYCWFSPTCNLVALSEGEVLANSSLCKNDSRLYVRWKYPIFTMIWNFGYNQYCSFALIFLSAIKIIYMCFSYLFVCLQALWMHLD
ncbi:hypothetical protein XENOCAPTIV_020877, partial [Xenoophorus captivus]